MNPYLNILREFTNDLAPECRRAFGEIQRLQVTPENAEVSTAQLVDALLARLQETLETTRFSAQIMPSKAPKDGWMIGFADRRNCSHGRSMGAYVVLVEKGVSTWGAFLDFLNSSVTWAANGEGCHGDARLRVSGRMKIADGILLLPWRTLDIINMDLMKWSAELNIHSRKTGQPTQDAMALAAGQADVLINTSLPPAEVLLFDLFIREAGGFVTDLKGQPVTPETTEIIAANSKLHGIALKAWIKRGAE